MFRIPLALLVALALLAALATPAVPAQAADCRFVLGFQALHDLIPTIVGDCLEDEQHNPGPEGTPGDGLQHTTNGLLVWRKTDNFTALTDGYRTWVNGPYGLQERLNSQRFPWEANPDGLPIVGPPADGRCAATTGAGKVRPLCPPA